MPVLVRFPMSATRASSCLPSRVPNTESSLLTSRYLSPRERESFRYLSNRHREQPYGFCSSPASNPLRTWRAETPETFVFLGRKRKTPGTGLTARRLGVFAADSQLETQAPREQPSSKTRARDSERDAVFPEKMKDCGSRASFWLIELLTRFSLYLAHCVNR